MVNVTRQSHGPVPAEVELDFGPSGSTVDELAIRRLAIAASWCTAEGGGTASARPADTMKIGTRGNQPNQRNAQNHHQRPRDCIGLTT